MEKRRSTFFRKWKRNKRRSREQYIFGAGLLLLWLLVYLFTR